MIYLNIENTEYFYLNIIFLLAINILNLPQGILLAWQSCEICFKHFSSTFEAMQREVYIKSFFIHRLLGY